jgi:Subtilase family
MASEKGSRAWRPKTPTMNAEFPPLLFPDPQIRPRRRERRGFEQPPLIPAEERRAIALNLHAQTRIIHDRLRELSPEAKRAVFLKLRHDRPLTPADLAGTDLSFMSSSGENESLVVPRKPEKFEKLDKRIEQFAQGEEPDRPKGTDFATAVQTIEIGDPKDRLSEDVLAEFDQWVGRDHIIYEMEVASFAVRASKAQQEVEDILAEVTASLGHGVHGAIYEFEMQERGARLVLWTTGAKFREFVEAENWWRKIVYFDARPKFETFHQTLRDFNIADISILPPDADSETICVIDTGVAAGNPFLAPILRTDVSRSFIGNFEATEDANGHGSGVASLVAYHTVDISAGAQNKAAARVASARIATDEGQFDVPWIEQEDAYRNAEARLFSRVLRDIVENYRPLGIRIFVLPFQVLGHIWSKAARRSIARSAWVARTIDQLSREFDVLFVTITGNISSRDIQELIATTPYPTYLVRPLAKLHDPGQSALALTIGSISHAAKVVVDPLVPVALESQPSPFTRSGPGFGESIKPDLIERGGNLVRNVESTSITSNAGTDIIMASSRLTPAVQHSAGTSFAAPRVAHHLALIARDLRAAGVELTNPLLRALIAVSATVPDGSEILENADNNLAVLGFGVGNGSDATDCSGSSVLLFWHGRIEPDSTALFKIHVPPDLQTARRGKKQIIVAVASMPPVQRWGIAEYLGAEMRFRLFRGDEDADKITALLQRDDEEANVPAAKEIAANDLEGSLKIVRRSTGTLQRDVFEWSDHKAEYSRDDYTLAVSLQSASWLRSTDAIPVAVVVRLRDTTGRYQELYAQVQAQVRAAVRVRA